MPVLHIGVENNTNEKIYMTNFSTDDDDPSHVNHSNYNDKHYIDSIDREPDVFRIGNFFGFKGSASLFCGNVELGKVEFVMPFSGSNRFHIRSFNKVINGYEFKLTEEHCSAGLTSYIEDKYIIVNSTAINK